MTTEDDVLFFVAATSLIIGACLIGYAIAAGMIS
jgi:hypothetical protein